VPNSSTDRLIAQGPLRKLKTIGPNAVGPGNGGYTFFSKGSHGSLFDPTASLAATVEMQRQAVLFGFSACSPAARSCPHRSDGARPELDRRIFGSNEGG